MEQNWWTWRCSWRPATSYGSKLLLPLLPYNSFLIINDTITSKLILLQANGHRVMTVSPRYDQYKDAWDTEVTIEVVYIINGITFIFKWEDNEFCLVMVKWFISLLFRLKWEKKLKRFASFIATKEELIVCLWITHCFLKRLVLWINQCSSFPIVFISWKRGKLSAWWLVFQVWGKTASKIYGPIAGEDFKDNQLRFSLLCRVSNLHLLGCFFFFSFFFFDEIGGQNPKKKRQLTNTDQARPEVRVAFSIQVNPLEIIL